MSVSPSPASSYGDIHSQFFAGHDLHVHIDAGQFLGELLDLLRSGPVQFDEGMLSAGERRLPLSRNLAEALHHHVHTHPAPDPAEREAHYLARLCINPDFQRWQRRFVILSGGFRPAPEITPEFSKLLVRGEGLERRIERVALPDIRQALAEHQTFILLAAPGAGKTTVLQKLALDQALRRLQLGQNPDPHARLPLFVRLAAQGASEPALDFLLRMWRISLPGAADAEFHQALQGGDLVILCDALNESRRQGYAERARDWREFARDLPPGNRLIFSCRNMDYQGDLAVQQVEIDLLSPAQIEDFACRYLGAELGAALWADLQAAHRDLLDLAKIPFYLLLLTEEYARNSQQLPRRRGHLFHQFVDRLLRREQERGHAEWIEPEAQHQALAELAFAMQEQGSGAEVTLAEAVQILPASVLFQDGRAFATPPAQVLRLAAAANLLALPFDGGVKFIHHLWQEYFAAAALLRRWGAGDDCAALWRPPWTRRAPPTARGEWNPLPPPPTTGWEETTITAASLAPALITAVRRANPALAARCLLEGGFDPAPASLQDARQDMQQRLSHPQTPLRSRIQAGLLLGRLGDPRFPVETVDGVKVILPDLVEIPGGPARIGSGLIDLLRFRQTDEHPRHTVPLAPYAIARYPLTRAEYACFIEAGGYEEEGYWTEGGKYWLRGENAPGEADPAAWWIQTWQRRRDNPAEIEEGLRRGWMTAHDARNWREYITWSEQDWLQAVRQLYPEGQRLTRPRFWEDEDFANPAQPVVGVCWYEAMAFANWLAAATGQPYRLPSEPEWEWAAARGSGRFPWGGRWRADRLNSLEGEERVMRTTPVGVYPTGTTPDGLHDLAGNVWEWTASRYAPYPYDLAADLENPDLPGLRVVRGGGWAANRLMVRCASRTGARSQVRELRLGIAPRQGLSLAVVLCPLSAVR